MENPNEKQLAALTELAKGVTSDYKSLEITEILNRINYITGRDLKKCIDGFKLMFRLGLIKADFVLNSHKLPKIEAMVGLAFPLIVSLDAEFVKPDDKVAEKFSNEPINTPIPPGEPVKTAMAIIEGPKDDIDALLPHLDSNF